MTYDNTPLLCKVKNSAIIFSKIVGKVMTLRDKKGFTLIELMVVVVILGILAGLIIPKIMGRPEEARRLKAKISSSLNRPLSCIA